MNTKKILSVLLGLGVVVLAITLFLNRESGFIHESEKKLLRVHFMDVGQGDATLLQGPDFTILIDAGRHDRNDVVPYLIKQNVQKIDLLIGTHPHADHIGQFPQVLDNFQVNEVWMSGDLHTTLTFERALDAIERTNAKYNEPRAGELYNIGSALLEVVHPTDVDGSLNDGSIVIKLNYIDINILFTGDAEVWAEQQMLTGGFNLDSHILKLGHHGSNTSSTQDFLNLVNPELAIYSAALGNRYGHPSNEVIRRLKNMDIVVLGTDKDGTIVIETDGESYSVAFDDLNLLEVPPKMGIDNIDNCIDINEASQSELAVLTHVGSKRAIELINNRPYSSLSELTRISGISTARLQDIIQQGKACIE